MFSEEIKQYSWEETTEQIYSKTDADVRREWTDIITSYNEKLKIRGLLKSLRSLESLGTLETLMGTIAAKPLLSPLSSLISSIF